MRKILSAIFLLIFCAVSHFAQSHIAGEEYKVYTKVLEKIGQGNILIEDTTSIDSSLESDDDIAERVKFFIPQISLELLTDFVDKNKANYKLQTNFTLKTYKILSREEIKRAFGEKDDLGTLDDLDNRWENFGKAYPNSDGFYILSRVGFDKTHSGALVFISNYCGSLCGQGEYFILKKTGNNWKILMRRIVWIS